MTEPAIAVSGLSKTYGATRALDGVTLDVRPGEIAGLIGTNGAGKSTLIKVLSGATRPSAGTLTLGGRRFAPNSPLDAQAAGVQTVHQNIDDGVVFGTTVAENLTLDSIAQGGGWFTTRRSIVARARSIAEAARLPLPLDAPVETLPASARQQIVLARALSRQARLLILDEPTSTLSTREADALAVKVREAAASGVAVLYVSHRLAEIESLCDRVIVLRDGRVSRTFTAPFTGAAIVGAMLGEFAAPATASATTSVAESATASASATAATAASATAASATATATATAAATAAEAVTVTAAASAAEAATPGDRGAVVLAATGIRVAPGREAFDLEVREGEVLGVTGLVGAGKTELLEQLGGARPLVSGELRLDGAPYRPRDPHAAIAAGVAFAAEERSAQAIVPGWSVRAHVSLPMLRAHSRGGLLRRRSEAAAARRVAGRFGVRGPGLSATAEPGRSGATESGRPAAGATGTSGVPGNGTSGVPGTGTSGVPGTGTSGGDHAGMSGRSRGGPSGRRGHGIEAPIETLSGGNQQKVVVGRWLEAAPRVLLLDEPFRGVDVGARADIGRVVREAAGMAVVVASSDPQEIVELADRVLVLHDGTPTGELAVAEATPERLAALMSGTETSTTPRGAEASTTLPGAEAPTGGTA